MVEFPYRTHESEIVKENYIISKLVYTKFVVAFINISFKFI